MAKQILEDVFTFVPSQVLEEDAGGKKLRFVEGRVQMAGVKNANGREYPRAVLEAAINHPKTQEALRENRMLGCLDHPSDGKTTLRNASHLVTDLKMTESGEVIGRWQILSTPDGQTLRALCEDGVSFGASTRCTGSLKDGPGGIKIVQNDLVWETVDAVYNPSTYGAYPKPVYESTDSNLHETEENNMSVADRFNALEQRVSKLSSIKAKALDEGTKSIVRKEITEAMVEASRLGQEAPEYKSLTESMINSLSGKRTTLTEETIGDADSGVLRYVPKEALPPEGDGGHVVDPAAVAVPSEMEQMITALVNEAEEEDDEDDEEKKKKKKFEEASADEDEEERKKRKKAEESEKQMESFAAGIVRNEKNSKTARGLAAAFLHERVRRVNESAAYKRIVGKMQEKLDEAISTGKVVVESDEKLAAKYQLVQDVLKETVRRYKITEARHYAVDRLIELNLADNDKARKFLAEAIKSNPVVTKTTIEEAITLFAKVSGMDLSKEVKKSSVPVPVTESKEEVKETITESVVPDAAKKELPLKDLSGKIAKLNESTSDQQASHGVALANRISRNMGISRSIPVKK